MRCPQHPPPEITGLLELCIPQAGGALLKEVALFDVYQGKGIASGFKSVAFTLTLRDDTRSITAGEADEEIAGILEALQRDCSAVIRS